MGADREKEEGTQGARQFLHWELSRSIIKAAFHVSNTLGCGFLEKVYENALVVGLKQMHLDVAQQVPVRILYLGQTVGDYTADLIVERKVLVEVKATAEDHPVHVAQTLNYLRATGLSVGLVMNFGRPHLSYRRLVMDKELPVPSADQEGNCSG